MRHLKNEKNWKIGPKNWARVSKRERERERESYNSELQVPDAFRTSGHVAFTSFQVTSERWIRALVRSAGHCTEIDTSISSLLVFSGSLPMTFDTLFDRLLHTCAARPSKTALSVSASHPMRCV